MLFSREGAAIWGWSYKQQDTTVNLLSVLFCFLNFDLGKRNADPEASKQNSGPEKD